MMWKLRGDRYALVKEWKEKNEAVSESLFQIVKEAKLKVHSALGKVVKERVIVINADGDKADCLNNGGINT